MSSARQRLVCSSKRGFVERPAAPAATLRPSFNPVPRGQEGSNEVSEKVVLEHDDLRRTLRRIAHEIAEKNPDSERSGGRRHPHPRRRPGPPPPRLPRRADRLRAADRRPRHLLLPRRRRRQVAGLPAGRPRLPHRLRPLRPHGRPRRRRPLHRPHRPRRDRGPLRLRPPASGSSSRSSATAATASCRSAPTTSARTCRPRARSGSTSASRSSTAQTR